MVAVVTKVVISLTARLAPAVIVTWDTRELRLPLTHPLQSQQLHRLVLPWLLHRFTTNPTALLPSTTCPPTKRVNQAPLHSPIPEGLSSREPVPVAQNLCLKTIPSPLIAPNDSGSRPEFFCVWCEIKAVLSSC